MCGCIIIITCAACERELKLCSMKRKKNPFFARWLVEISNFPSYWLLLFFCFPFDSNRFFSRADMLFPTGYVCFCVLHSQGLMHNVALREERWKKKMGRNWRSSTKQTKKSLIHCTKQLNLNDNDKHDQIADSPLCVRHLGWLRVVRIA